jgi:uncharacterized membrane protein YkvI
LAEEIKNTFKVASIYITTIIGAGFASGREIVQFFSSYYQGGFYGIIFAGLLFSIIGYLVLDKVYKERIRSYDEFLFPMLGWSMGWIVETISTLFMISLFSVMVAGSGSIITEIFSLPFKYAIILTAFICMIFILTDTKGIVTLSSIITPFMIVGILVVGFYIIMVKDVTVFKFGFARPIQSLTHNWFFSALLYVSYNSILSIAIMCSLLPYLNTRKTGVAGGILGGAVLCLIAFVLHSAISIFYPESMAAELPVLNIVERYGGILSGLYTLILWLSMFTSAVASGYCFVNRVSKKLRANEKLLAVISCAIVIPMSSFGFSNLISTVYPIFGYAGLFMIFTILFQGLRMVPTHIYKQKNNK